MNNGHVHHSDPHLNNRQKVPYSDAKIPNHDLNSRRTLVRNLNIRLISYSDSNGKKYFEFQGYDILKLFFLFFHYSCSIATMVQLGTEILSKLILLVFFIIRLDQWFPTAGRR